MLTAYDDQDVAALRRAFSGFPSGVAALAAVVDDEPRVLVASSFAVGISQDPPLVLFSVQKTSTTWPHLSRATSIGASILGSAHSGKAWQLASKDREKRFRGVRTIHTPAGAILLEEAPVMLECGIEHVYPAGDHHLIVLRVTALSTNFDHEPLIWHRSGFTRLIELSQEPVAR